MHSPKKGLIGIERMSLSVEYVVKSFLRFPRRSHNSPNGTKMHVGWDGECLTYCVVFCCCLDFPFSVRLAKYSFGHLTPI